MNSTNQTRIQLLMNHTIANLEFVEQMKTKYGPYEITQLVNSFLGALAHRWEELKDEFKKISIADAVKNGWPSIKKQLPTDVDPKNLGELVRLMRNGMAHGGIQLLPTGDREIEEIQIVNVDPKCGHRTWGTVLSIKDVRKFLDKFVETAKTLISPQAI